MHQDIKRLFSDTLEAIGIIDSAKSGDQAFNSFRAFVRKHEAISVAIGQLVNPIIKGKDINEFGWHDWPDEWAERYGGQNYVIHDPVSRFALKTRYSFEWKTAREHATRFGLKIMDEGSKFNFTDGITIPVQAGNNPIGLVSLGFESDKIPDKNTISSLELAAIHCYTKLLQFTETNHNSACPELTKREIDVLSFVAIGKTNWEISKVLGIAETSAAQHIKNIAKKLNAANRAHAVTIAVQSGQIIP